MMNLTTMPLSFWDYALESATGILNMVLTKKVDKTPYELWPERTHRAHDCLCINVEVEEYSLGDLNEPTNYKAALLDPEFNKWLDAMNAQMQSMKDNQVWRLINLSPDAKTIGNIRAIRILIVITTYYDYRIWKMDVKTAFLNGYLNEDIHMVQPEDLGGAAFILGIKIYRDRSKWLIGLSQSAYTDKIFKRFRMDNSKRGNIPMQERLDLNNTQIASTPKEVGRMQNAPYTSAIRSIMSEALDNCEKYSQVFKKFLVYGGNLEAELSAIDWKSSKQSTTAMSTTEAENIDASEVVMGAVWIRKFISGLGIVPINIEPMKMYCDNYGATIIANESGVHKGARHYPRRYHYALPNGKLTKHARSIGLRLAIGFM
ncbi:hypothetical protein Tco_1392714 [Tanacetum coccineum]